MKKHIYVFLCMIIAVALALIVQRGLLALYLIFAAAYPDYNVLPGVQLQIVNWVTSGIAVIIGLLYGNYLGHHWYPLVYGEDGTGVDTVREVEIEQKTVTVKPARATSTRVSLRTETREREEQDWDFDDLIGRDLAEAETLAAAATTEIEDEPVRHVAVKEVKATKPAVPAKRKKTATAKSTTKPAAKPAAKKSVTKTKTATKPAAKRVKKIV